MRGPALPVALALLCLVVAIFYLIPGPTHPFVSDDPTGAHLKHALLFFGLAVLSGIWARFARNAGPTAARREAR